MSEEVVALLIFVVCIILFIIDKLPMATTAFLGCALMVIFGVCDFSTAFGQMASSTVVLTIGVMIIGAAIGESGLANTIGSKIIALSGNSEKKLLVGVYIVSALMSAFLTNSAVLAIFIPIIMGLASTGNVKAKNLIMPIAIACVLGGASTLVGSTQQMTAQGLLEGLGGRTFNTFDFTPIGGGIALIGLLYCLFIGYNRGEKIWGNNNSADNYDEAAFAVDTTKFSKSKQIFMICIFLFTIVFYITEWLPLAVTSTVAALLCIITGCISQKSAISKVNWNIVGRLAGCLGMAKALEVSGATDLVSGWFMQAVGSWITPYLLFCIIVLLTQVTSEFITNSTALIMVLPIVFSIAPVMGLDTYTYALGATLASAMTLSNPLSSSTLGMSMVAGFKMKDYFKYSFPLDVISYFVIIIFVPLTNSLII